MHTGTADKAKECADYASVIGLGTPCAQGLEESHGVCESYAPPDLGS